MNVSKFAGHTPGPWCWDELHRWIDPGVICLSDVASGPTPADLALILAAPRLLEERNRLLVALKGWVEAPYSWPDPSDRAKEAIAFAELDW